MIHYIAVIFLVNIKILFPVALPTVFCLDGVMNRQYRYMTPLKIFFRCFCWLNFINLTKTYHLFQVMLILGIYKNVKKMFLFYLEKCEINQKKKKMKQKLEFLGKTSFWRLIFLFDYNSKTKCCSSWNFFLK